MKKFLIILLFLIPSCSSKHWWKPNGSVFGLMPKGTPGFELGWVHGCESGLGTIFGGNISMFFYTWHRDVQITKTNPTQKDIEDVRKRYPKELKGVDWNNPDDVKRNFSHYNFVFWQAHAICRQTAIGRLHNAAMNPAIPGDTRVKFEQYHIGNVYKIDGRGDARWGNGYW